MDALVVPKFGSQDSGINRTADVAPNSNVYRVEGSNPIYSIEQSSNSNHDDSFDNIRYLLMLYFSRDQLDDLLKKLNSQSSGDSIFIGVEDNPEFRDYKNNRVNGKVNNGFVQEALPFTNVTRRNPLINEPTSHEISEPSYPPPPPPPRSAKRPAPPVPVVYEDFGEEDESVDDIMDANFSFGNVIMTEV